MTANTTSATSSGAHNSPTAQAHEIGRDASMDAIVAIASSGFRLSLVLNAVGTGMANPDCDIHNIAKHISLFALMLKQTAGALQEGRPVVSQTAIDVATEISQYGQLVFNEIKSMTDLSQGRDEKGILRSITIAEKNKWAFKKYKVQYLLGQLESLKLSLAIILQVVQMGQGLAITLHPHSAQPLTGKSTMQERAEIQNMVVVQHWSLVELRKLYELAENEAREEASSPLNDEPPPSYDEHRAIEANHYTHSATVRDPQLSLTAPPRNDEDTLRAIVRYQEKPLQQLDAAFTKSLTRENRALGANVINIVDHLLREWTQIPELDSRPILRDRRPSLSTYYESDEEDTTESEYEGSYVKGRSIEGPPPSKRKVKKDVRFRARVESESEEEAAQKSHRQAPRKHVLHSEDDTSSDSELSSPIPRSQPDSRRGSEASNSRHKPNVQETYDRNARPYSSGTQSHRPEIPNGNSSGRPGSRGIPPPPMGPMPTRSMPNVNQWQGTPPMAQPGFRPPPYQGSLGVPPRQPSYGSVVPPGYIGHSPQPVPGNYFPQQQQRPQGPPPTSHPPRLRHHRHRSERQKVEDDKHSASKNLKRGLFGGAALAGIVDLLQGLDGI